MNSIIGWVGGKNRLKKIIADYIPKDINSYIEPFGGAGWVLVYKDKWSDTEVYNDLDERLVNMFRQIKYNPQKLIDELLSYPIDKETFEYFKSNPGNIDVEKGARFIYLRSVSWGSQVYTFSIQKTFRGFEPKAKNIELLSKRLKDVIIENESYEQILDKYDDNNSFFYIDPPYTDRKIYKLAKNFNHQELKDRLNKIKGRFLLSYNDCIEIRELYNDFNIICVDRHNTLPRKHKGKKLNKYKELLIANYDLNEVKEINLNKDYEYRNIFDLIK